MISWVRLGFHKSNSRLACLSLQQETRQRRPATLRRRIGYARLKVVKNSPYAEGGWARRLLRHHPSQPTSKSCGVA
jgi:hypothetical protein